MKIIHCADVHLGSKIEAKLTSEKAEIRRREVRDAFRKMVDFAKRNEVKAVILAGDVFDSDRPAKTDKEFFYNQVRSNPEIDFFYLRGNHDSKAAYIETDIPNLKTFKETWTSYDLGGVTVYGIESTEINAFSMYNELSPMPSQINIVVLHGELADHPGANKIVLRLLGNKNIDYLALGHIHAAQKGVLPNRGDYCYSGCLEGRGFDEIGAKGFVVLDIDEEEKAVGATFVNNSVRTIEEVTVDVTGTIDTFDAATRAKNSIETDSANLVRVNLVGEVTYETDALAENVTESLMPYYFFVSVKDKTEEVIDYKKYLGEQSLRGEFVRMTLDAKDIDESEKQKVIKTGLRALAGRDVN